MLDHHKSMLELQFKHALADDAICFAPMETIGDRIRLLREAKGWRQEDLAERLSARLTAMGHGTVTGASVSQWERGETKNIKNVTFYVLVRELGAQEEYLLFGPQGPNQRSPNSRFGNQPPGSRTDSNG